MVNSEQLSGTTYSMYVFTNKLKLSAKVHVVHPIKFQPSSFACMVHDSI